MPRQFANSNLYDVIKTQGDVSITPSMVLTDPVGKLRVSTPQALIDTDFEYSTQSTKWETLNLLNNRPSAFYDVTTPLPVTAVSASTTTVTVTSTTTPAVGTPIFVQGTTNTTANGWFLVDTVSAGVSFTYITNTSAGTGSIFDSTKTYIFAASFYSGAAIPVSASAGAAFTASTTTVTCTTNNAHGLSAGDAIYVVGTTAATSGPPNGSWIVRTTPTVNTFTFTVLVAPSGAITATAGATSTLYPRPFGSVIHRSFDGGVALTTGYPYAGNQLIRQTRRYFRYQSGKGIQFSTGTSLKPAFSVDSLTRSGTTVTVTTKFPHNINTGALIKVTGSSESAYNGTFTVVTAPTDTTFTYTALVTPTISPAPGFPITVAPESWYGSTNRIGLFDEQNGFFFEFNGQTLSVVKRSSTTQLSGSVTVSTSTPTTVTGSNTTFSTQLTPGDYIVIRGMSYLVQSISSDTSMVIYPEYRGTNGITNTIVSKTTNERYPQNSWNIDHCDGTGPTQFNLNLTKMQMFYIDYAWYGAGAIRFGFKDQSGNIMYCHIIPNSNINSEAYMRSGNICARYEANTLPVFTTLSASITSSATTSLTVASTTGFPTAGVLAISAPGNTTSAIEYVRYTGLTATTFTGLTRGVTNLTGPGGLTGGGGASGTAFTYSATAPVQVSLFPNQFSSTISHWGSAVIMDGRYDDDKSFIFQAGQTTPLSNLAASASAALLSIRLAPSVDSGITGILGARDLINRMQLTLRQMDIVATGTAAIFRVELVLNGRIGGSGAGAFASAGGSSLAQIATHSTAGSTTVTGGETILSFFVYTPNVVQQDLNLVRDLGNSILGGGLNNTVPTGTVNLFPDGPDVVTIRVTNVSAVTTSTIASRLSWTEAQA